MCLNSRNSFVGIPFGCSLGGRNGACALSVRKKLQQRRLRYRKCLCSKKQNDWNWITQAIRFSHFCGKNVEILRNAISSRSGFNGVVVKEPLLHSKALVKLVSPLWNEGLIFVRCSAFIAVISGVCLLVFYGQSKAKSYAERKLLPAVSSMLSDYLQREVNFGKVRSVSPFGITLESCSIGPHCEEFSCSEVPLVKLRLFPFASLRSGKVVVDAVLSQPTVLIAQKKDYTWLGLPYPSEDVVQRHSSAEEGIDYRTKTRRNAREELAASWTLERDKDAKGSAEKGYILPVREGTGNEGDAYQESSARFPEFSSYKSFLLDDKLQWRDHQCMDTDLDYDMKHADLEKSFGVKFPGSGLRFWSRASKGPKNLKFDKKSNRNIISTPSDDAKRRVLDRSSSFAVSYFNAISAWNYDESSLFHCFYDDSMNQNVSMTEIKLSDSEKLSVGSHKTPEETVNGALDQQSVIHQKRFGEKIDKLTLIRDSYLMTLNILKDAGSFSESVSNDENDTLESKAIADKGTDLIINGVSSETPEDNSCQPTALECVYSEGVTSYPTSDRPIQSQNGLHCLWKRIGDFLYLLLFSPESNIDRVTSELIDDVDTGEMSFPVLLDSVQFKGGNLMLLAYGDREPREMENVSGHVKLQNNYGRVYVQLSGDCKIWRSDAMSDDGGWLSADVFVDILEQQWHANLKISNFFAPLFERILEIPITWSDGRAIGEVHVCMSKGENFPNLHGQIDVTGLSFKIFDAPSSFSDVSASLRFRGQRVFVHNGSGSFGSVPLEASGDFGIHPDEGEYHLMCQVPSVEVNALMRTFKMRPLLFPLAGSVTAVFNCQGPLDAPIFVGSGMASRKISNVVSDLPASAASEAVFKSKESGAIAAFDHIPISYLSANFTFNTDNCVADLYGIRASLLDGGEVRGAGNAWICPEGEVDETAMDINFSGNLCFDNIMDRYLPGYLYSMPVRMGDLTGETKLTGSLLRPRFDVKWVAPVAEGSFSDARGDIIISHDYITINSSSVAFDLYAKIYTTYQDENWHDRSKFDAKRDLPFTVDGIELDLRMRGFEFFALESAYPFDSPRPTHMKATGKLKFQGNVLKTSQVNQPPNPSSETNTPPSTENVTETLAGEVSISGLRLNQLTLAPQLTGQLSISRDHMKLDATGRPDESLAVEVQGTLSNVAEDNHQNDRMWSFSLQKGQLKANFRYRPMHTAALEVRNLPLDELELASLRGTIQRAEIQLSLLKRRGHGILSVLHPKFSGVLGEALDVAARWSGDVITIEKAVLEQTNSQYELQGEYVLPGSRDRSLAKKERVGLLERAMTGQLNSVIASMGRWRMRLEVPRAEVSEMLPLARLLSRSKDPAVLSRSKDFFMQSLQSLTLVPDSLQHLLEVVRGYYTSSTEVVLEDFSLPGLAELKGYWRGCLDASGGGNGDTVAEFDLHGEDWEWGAYKTQRVLALGAYSNDDGLRLDRIFIQKDNATVHADGILFGPKTNLHFAVLNFPVGLVPTLVQVIESTAAETVHSLRQFLSPIRGVLHMEGDLRGSLVKPECDVQVRLLDGSIGGIDLGRAEVAASVTPNSRFLFNAKLEPSIQNGHVHIQGSVPITFVSPSDEGIDADASGSSWNPGWVKERVKESTEDASDKKLSQDRNEDGWNTQLAESLKVLNWNFLDVGEVRLDADIKDGGMMLLTALSPYANWLHGNADVMLEVRGTVEQPILDGYASFHRASVSSPFLRRPLTNFGGTLHIKSNRLCITSLESRVSRRGKLLVKGNLPFKAGEASLGDKIDLKCEDLEVRAKNLLSAQVDTQLRITGSILQPNIGGNIKLSHGEAYLPHDKGSGATPFNRLSSAQSQNPRIGINKLVSSRYFSRLFSSEPAPPTAEKTTNAEKDSNLSTIKPKLDVRLSSLKLALGPELRIVYPLILNFGISGELDLNGLAHPKWIKPKGVFAFENGDVNLVATQVRLKRDHLNVAKFEPEYGLDPILDLALVGSEWQFRIQSRASTWQEKLVVTSMHSVEQEALSPSEAARVFESQLADSILESDGKLAFKKLATATLETLMPRIEGKGEFGHARWRLVYAPQIPSLLSVDPTIDPLKSLASNISFGTEVEVQLGKRLQASIVRQMKDSEMAVQWTLIYQLTKRLRLLLQSAPTKRLLFEYSATSQT